MPRNFDDKELRELLRLKQNEFTVMRRLERSNKVDPAKLPWLGNHVEVLGIHKHDPIYRQFPNRYGSTRSVKKRKEAEGAPSSVATTSLGEVHHQQERSKVLRQVSESGMQL